jgi:hypothetical protein
MTGAGTPGPGAGHPAWCVIDVLRPGGQWHCCSDYTEVDLSLRTPGGDGSGANGGGGGGGAGGGIARDKVSIFLAQGPYDIRPRLWLAYGDIAAGDRVEAAELTVTEARKLVQALTDAITLATPPGPAPFVVVPGAGLRPAAAAGLRRRCA